MGEYIYRVTSKTVKCSDGGIANVAVFAYKPYYDNDAENSKMHFRSGCTASERMAKNGKVSDRFVIGDEFGNISGPEVFQNTKKMPVFSDFFLGDRLPVIANVKAK